MTSANPLPASLFERISDDVLHVLTHEAKFDEAGVALHLTGTLKPNLYQAVNEVLTRLDGRWNARRRAHIFEQDARDLLREVVTSGRVQVRNPTAFFPTPSAVCDLVIASLEPDRMAWREQLRVLEPSAGKGALLDALRPSLEAHLAQEGAPRNVTVHACELLPGNRLTLRAKGYDVVSDNFLEYSPSDGYDLILMNPPFSVPGDKNAWVTHLLHAWSLLNPGGRLVAILPDTLRHRSDRQVMDVYALAALYGHIEEIGRGAFKASGTNVNTIVLTLDRDDVAWRRQPVEDWASHMTFNASLIVDCDATLNEERRALAAQAAAGKLAAPAARDAVRALYTRVQERERHNLSLLLLTEEDHQELFEAFCGLVEDMGGFMHRAQASRQTPLLAV
ncbi:methyltransferase [Deinococcus soli (ex Cha et al. 2016)]|uniref:Uncharacterized protein n=2 Tax=Deinococcus soli (ex Cha et al. 2016) TaxID=1309411 RepID=A0ACC6KGM5_9DEIO|nr:methyltransferase [Deinococcus soli (ex Cha et al. 2016)]MDR6218168.1 hypothetical protein [Deinococcus soli (ex Cha et al. 2016)]MDR6328908.1 hypothetical protein [Deinococcus soli (ex Cha et al. 2016)]MDR6751604.1 hypothetical protein [Deinococcus soli (ex Cha et al. 2016)]